MTVARLASDTRAAASRGRVPKALALARHLLWKGSITEEEARRHVRVGGRFRRELQRLRDDGLVVAEARESTVHRRGHRVVVTRYYLRSVPKALLDEIDRVFPR